MTEGEIKMNKRATGIHRTVFSNPETGAKEVIYESRRTSIQFWMGIVAQILAIAVVAVAAMKVGIDHQTQDIIRTEMKPPGGLIYNGIEASVQRELDPLKEQITTLTVKQDITNKMIEDIRLDVREIRRSGE